MPGIIYTIGETNRFVNRENGKVGTIFLCSLIVEAHDSCRSLIMENKTYIVLYVRNGRIASFENTEDKLGELVNTFNVSLIQRDYNGTLHYNVFGVNKQRVNFLARIYTVR